MPKQHGRGKTMDIHLALYSIFDQQNLFCWYYQCMPVDYRKVFRFRGGVLCLDFANTVHWPLQQRVELFESFDLLLVWARLAGILSTHERARIPVHARAMALSQAIALRDAVQRIGLAHTGIMLPTKSALTCINQMLSAAHSRRQFVLLPGGLHRVADPKTPSVNKIFDAVAISFEELFTQRDVTRLKRCARCDWLFYDDTKNNGRRWCSMQSCGTHIKAQAYYRRKKAQTQKKGGNA